MYTNQEKNILLYPASFENLSNKNNKFVKIREICVYEN